MSMGKNSYAVIMVITIILVTLLILNSWLSKQMDTIQKEPSTTITPAVQPAMTAKEAARYGMPKIDPLNDPLAPVVHEEPKKVETKASSAPSEKTYEIPQASPLLAQ